MNYITSTKRLVSRYMSDESGVALFLALILLSTLSVLTVSMMFLSQSESMSSGNYRLMTQARYGAEAGVQKAADYIRNTYDTNTAAVLLPANSSPVMYDSGGGLKPVVLSSDPNHPSNYPDAPTAAAFLAATAGQITAGNSTISYTTYATLVGMEKIDDAYTGNNKIIQTWQITSDAMIAGVRRSTVEVTASIDSPKVPAISFAAFSTSQLCDSLHFQGNVKTNSYNSNDPDFHPYSAPGVVNPTYSAPQYCASGPNSAPGCMDNTGGDVGTNGNLDIQGHVDVKGNLSSPITGVGACTNNNGVASTALTASGAATVEGGAPLELPQTIMLPTPKQPATTTAAPVSLGSSNVATACGVLNIPVGVTTCTVSGNTVTVVAPPGFTLPPISLGDHVNLVLQAPSGGSPLNRQVAEYDLSSLQLSGQSSFAVKTDSPYDTVSVFLSGKYADNSDIPTVIDFQGGASASDATFGSVQGCQLCSPYDANLMGFFYGGTGAISMVGNSSASATVYAPNATATLSGTSDLYGSIISKTLTINGGGGGPNGMSVNFDQNLSNTGVTAGRAMLNSFSWKKY